MSHPTHRKKENKKGDSTSPNSSSTLGQKRIFQTCVKSMLTPRNKSSHRKDSDCNSQSTNSSPESDKGDECDGKLQLSHSSAKVSPQNNEKSGQLNHNRIANTSGKSFFGRGSSLRGGRIFSLGRGRGSLISSNKFSQQIKQDQCKSESSTNCNVALEKNDSSKAVLFSCRDEEHEREVVQASHLPDLVTCQASSHLTNGIKEQKYQQFNATSTQTPACSVTEDNSSEEEKVSSITIKNKAYKNREVEFDASRELLQEDCQSNNRQSSMSDVHPPYYSNQETNHGANAKTHNKLNYLEKCRQNEKNRKLLEEQKRKISEQGTSVQNQPESVQSNSLPKFESQQDWPSDECLTKEGMDRNIPSKVSAIYNTYATEMTNSQYAKKYDFIQAAGNNLNSDGVLSHEKIQHDNRSVKISTESNMKMFTKEHIPSSRDIDCNKVCDLKDKSKEDAVKQSKDDDILIDVGGSTKNQSSMSKETPVCNNSTNSMRKIPYKENKDDLSGTTTKIKHLHSSKVKFEVGDGDVNRQSDLIINSSPDNGCERQVKDALLLSLQKQSNSTGCQLDTRDIGGKECSQESHHFRTESTLKDSKPNKEVNSDAFAAVCGQNEFSGKKNMLTVTNCDENEQFIHRRLNDNFDQSCFANDATDPDLCGIEDTDEMSSTVGENFNSLGIVSHLSEMSISNDSKVITKQMSLSQESLNLYNSGNTFTGSENNNLENAQYKTEKGSINIDTKEQNEPLNPSRFSEPDIEIQDTQSPTMHDAHPTQRRGDLEYTTTQQYPHYPRHPAGYPYDPYWHSMHQSYSRFAHMDSFYHNYNAYNFPYPHPEWYDHGFINSLYVPLQHFGKSKAKTAAFLEKCYNYIGKMFTDQTVDLEMVIDVSVRPSSHIQHPSYGASPPSYHPPRFQSDRSERLTFDMDTSKVETVAQHLHQHGNQAAAFHPQISRTTDAGDHPGMYSFNSNKRIFCHSERQVQQDNQNSYSEMVKRAAPHNGDSSASDDLWNSTPSKCPKTQSVQLGSNNNADDEQIHDTKSTATVKKTQRAASTNQSSHRVQGVSAFLTQDRLRNNEWSTPTKPAPNPFRDKIAGTFGYDRASTQFAPGLMRSSSTGMLKTPSDCTAASTEELHRKYWLEHVSKNQSHNSTSTLRTGTACSSNYVQGNVSGPSKTCAAASSNKSVGKMFSNTLEDGSPSMPALKEAASQLETNDTPFPFPVYNYNIPNKRSSNSADSNASYKLPMPAMEACVSQTKLQNQSLPQPPQNPTLYPKLQWGPESDDWRKACMQNTNERPFNSNGMVGSWRSMADNNSGKGYPLNPKMKRRSDSVLEIGRSLIFQQPTKQGSPGSTTESTAQLPIVSPLSETKNREWLEKFNQRAGRYKTSFIDTHCHLDLMYTRLGVQSNTTFAAFKNDHKSYFPDSFEGCVAIFCYPNTYDFMKPLNHTLRAVEDDPQVWIALGCHPKATQDFNESNLEGLKRELKNPKVVAIGEIGLDYSAHFAQRKEKQKEVFRHLLRIAVQMNLPIVIHCRDADDDCLEILQEMVPKQHKIHAHCFTRGLSVAQRWLDAFPNLWLGFTPVISYGTATDAKETAAYVPLDRILLETDAPYFVPATLKGTQYSYPGLALRTAELIAYLKDIPVEQVLKACRQNTRNMYGI